MRELRFARSVRVYVATLLLFAPLLGGCNRSTSTDRVLVIGAVLPLSGDNAKYGNWIREGLELYKDQLNLSGGVNGARLEIQYEDDKANPADAVTGMNRLIQVYHPPVIYGSWASSCVLAQAPIAERTRTIVMAQAISPKIRDAGDFMFRAIPDAAHSLADLVPYAFGQGARKLAILYVNNDYGLDQARVFNDKFRALGGTIAFNEGYSSDTKNFLPLLTRLKSATFDSLYLAGYSEVGQILRQAKELGIATMVYSSDPFENEDILEVAKDAAEGVVYPAFYIQGRGPSKLRDFEESYLARFDRYPEGSAALAYNGLDVIVTALKQADNNEAAERAKVALYRLTAYDGILGQLSIDDHGDMHLPVYLKTVRNGRFVEIR